jgi:hypothetical protein
VLSGLLLPQVLAAPGGKPAAIFVPLPIRSLQEISAQPLTTDQASVLAPELANGHRLAWLVDRDIKLENVHAEALPEGGGYRLGADGVAMLTRGYLRPRNSGFFLDYQKNFSCAAQAEDAAGPATWSRPPFRVLEGSRVALASAMGLWEELISARVARLTLLLDRVRAVSAEQALSAGVLVFERWRSEVSREWGERVFRQARSAEWAYYLEQAKALGVCPRSKEGAGAVVRPSWSQVIEPPAKATWSEGALSDPGAIRKRLARAPSRRWEGRYVIRATVEALGRRMTGQFLVDSAASISLLSPGFLQGQGVNPALIEDHDEARRILIWSGGRGAGPLVKVTELEVAGYRSPMQHFGLLETELFSPPDFVGTCCDGVLGSDFLALDAVALTPALDFKNYSILQIYESQAFPPPPAYSWIEVARDGQGFVSSDCALVSGKNRIEGVRWSTGLAAAAQAEPRFAGLISKVRSSQPAGNWNLECAGKAIASGLEVTVRSGAASPGTKESSTPAHITMGAPFLARNTVILDALHGRLWFEPGAWNEAPRRWDSGLDVFFDFAREADIAAAGGKGLSLGDRVLLVTGMRKSARVASELAKLGVRNGTRILKIDGKPADEWDLWQVQKRLQGVGGPKVEFEWQSREGTRNASVELVK